MSGRSGLFLNSMAQAGVRILGSVCSLVLTWLIARRSADALGVFRTLFSYLLIGDFVALLGMQTYLIREISLHPQELKKQGLHALLFALIVAFGGMLIMSGLAFFGQGYSQTIRDGLFIVAGSLPATAASLVGISILIGIGKTTTCSLIQGVETLVRTAISIVFVLLGAGILPIIATMVAVRWLLPTAYWRKVKPLLTEGTWTFDAAFFRDFLRHVPTFIGITLLAMALRFAAPLMLPWVLDDAAAGQFAAAYIFIDLVLLVPTALTINLVPLLARKAQEPGPVLVESCRLGVKVMALGVLPIAAILAAVAGPMFASVFPGKVSYAVSASVLKVVIWTCCLQAIDQVLSAAIVAKGKQHIDLQTLAIGTTSMLVLLAILVPAFGVIGAAFGVLGGLSFLVVTRFVLVGRQLGRLQPLELLWRPVIASAASMIVAIFVARFQWLVGAVCGGLTYLGVLGALGAFAQTERDGMLRLLQAGKA